MWRPISILIALLLLAAAPAPGDAPRSDLLTPKAISELKLDELFDKLAAEKAESRAGRALEVEILERFNRSGSATADLLFSWAMKAIAAEKYPLALDVLDQVILVKPDFAEGWNKRATVYFLQEDYSSALSDIRQTLALQPKHFGALAGLGMIMDGMDHKAEAEQAFRKALEIDPLLGKVREALERLEKETAGDSI